MDARCYSDSNFVAIFNNNNSNINVIVYGNCSATYRNHSHHGTPCHNLGCGNNIPDVGVPLFVRVCCRHKLGGHHKLDGRHELGAAYNNNNSNKKSDTGAS
jgi:hypothetical protein